MLLHIGYLAPIHYCYIMLFYVGTVMIILLLPTDECN